MIRVANIAQMFEAGQQSSQENRKRKTLRDFLQPALGGDQAAMGKVFGVAPEMGMQVQGWQAQQQKAQREQMAADREEGVRVAKAYMQTRDPALAQMLVPHLKRLRPDMPDNALSLPGAEEGMMQAAQVLASLGGQQEEPAGVREFNALTANLPEAERQRALRVHLGLEAKAAPPPQPNFQLYDGADGPVWLAEPTGGPMGAANVAGPSGGAERVLDDAYRGAMVDPTSDFPDLASKFPGTQVTSLLRDPQKNADVGGVSNSYHLKGQAGDFVVPQAQKAAFMAEARARGYDAIDEGDHVHLEPRRGAQAASSFGGMTTGMGSQSAGGVIPVPGVRPKPKAADKPSALQERIELARSMGATEDQLRQIVLGETGGGKPSATQIKLANTAKQKLIDLRAIENQLAQVEQAFGPLKGSLSAGLGGNFLPTVEGKRFDGSVGLLQGMVRKLTRTPGEGAMSDYETKLAQLANPSRGDYEDVTADKIQQLRALIQVTRQGYEALLQDAGGSSANLPQAGGSGALTPEEQAELEQLRARFGRK